MTRREHRQNTIFAMPFADRNQPYLRRGSNRRTFRCCDPGENRLEICRRIGGYDFVVGDHVMASAHARAKLARAAYRLNARYPRLPALILMTDERRLPDPVAAVRTLPKGAAVILRHTDTNARAALAQSLSPVARSRGLLLLIANDAPLAARLGCAGVHLSELHAHEAAHLKALHPSWFITVAAHSARAVARAKLCKADAVLLAAPFPTESHIGRAALGAARFRFLARSASVPLYALGGVNAQNVSAVACAHVAGIAAIEALLPIKARN